MQFWDNTLFKLFAQEDSLVYDIGLWLVLLIIKVVLDGFLHLK